MSYTQPLCLSLLSNCKTLTSLKQIHANLLKSGHHTDHFVAGKLLLHCAITLRDSLDYACTLFRHTPDPDGFMYNTLIRGLAEADKPRLSIVTFVEMTRRRVSPPDSFSFAFVLKSVANLRYLRAGTQVHCQAVTRGMHTHVFVGTTLISMYGECGCIGSAMKVFDEMPQPNIVAWNAVLTACFRCGDLEAARELFDSIPFKNLTSWNVMLAGYLKAGALEQARKGFMEMPVKDEVSWSTMIVGLVHNECFEEAFEVFRELHGEGKLRPNEASLTGVLSACAQAGALEFGKIIHGFVEKSGFAWIVSVNNALLDTYSKCGNVGMARLVFDQMPNRRSIVSWTSMIAALAMHGYGNEAIELFRKMEESGITPDGITFISLLYACSHTGLVEQGCEYFDKMRNIYNMEPAIEHYGCMVDLYGRAGQLFKAYEFVCQMPIPPNAVIWRTLLGACSIHGNVKLAEQVKKKLAELEPNDSGDHVLLSNIYAVAGKWKDVAAVRRSMTDHKIQKTPGWSMIEVDKTIYTFVAGTKQDKITEEAYEKLKEIMLRLRVEGNYIPEVSGVLYDIEEEEKEDSVTTHSEKLAVAFGIARLREGKTIKIVKNLRICSDCHAVFKLISQIYNLEIVVRDRNRFHSFKGGCCSCSGYW
ncbi:Pentatricopeptide repeat-containing protein [Turnera subulata]|uniref:Pentatricopeptide repeat-containing protein n=1 Tax=Turnera subulata TaxID=218843 RepID=A0A9Q0F5F1_9ROSI|nr:Pentatricopeptide repeat-containing protein [Turnera subulata]